ncbi:unnamed protein product [Caenorhabditis brenneri]
MVTHTDYPIYGECQIGYPDDLDDGGTRKRLVSSEGEDEWFLNLFDFDYGEKISICTSLNCFGIKHYMEFRVHYYLGFMNHQDESKSKVFDKKLDTSTNVGLHGPEILKSDVLDNNNGWLKDGKLTVVYGIHVEAFKETIWKFNLYHPMFRCEQANNTFAFGHNEAKRNVLYSHKQLLMHHFLSVLTMDKKYVDAQDYFKFDSLEKCLQILNGARIRLELSDLLNVLKMAHYFNLYNVVRYCEMELVQNKDEIKIVRNRIQFATHCKLSRYLACALREKESPEAIKEDFRQVNIDRMTGEMMKQCVMYLLRFY